MADNKISELTAVVTPADADTLPTVSGGATKKITWTVIKVFLKTYFDTLYRAIDYNNYAADAGSTDAYAITVTPSISAYVIGMEFTFKANTANTGACTLNVNGIAAIAIKKNVTVDLSTGDILAGQILVVKYDGTYMQLMSIRTVDATAMSGIVPIANLPVPAYYQRVAVPSVTTNTIYGSTSNTDGSVLVVMESTATLKRFARDTNTGTYIQTASVTVTSGSSFSSICILGSYVYVFIDSGNNVICYRYNLADLTSETAMTIPAIDSAGANYAVSSWTDGTYIYLMTQKAATTAYKLSISGTTFTTVTTSTTAATGGDVGSWMFDGTNIYQLTKADGTFTIGKASDVFLASITNTTKSIGYEIDAVVSGCPIINIDTNRIYVGYQMDTTDETAVRKQIIVLIPVTKP